MCFDNRLEPSYESYAQFGLFDYQVPLAGYTKKLSIQNITMYNDPELPIYVRCGGNSISGNTHKYLVVVGFRGNNEYEPQELIALVSSQDNAEDIEIEQILKYTPIDHVDAQDLQIYQLEKARGFYYFIGNARPGAPFAQGSLGGDHHISFVMRFYEDGDSERTCWVPLGRGSTVLSLGELKRIDAPEDTRFSLSRLDAEGNSWGSTLNLDRLNVWSMIALN